MTFSSLRSTNLSLLWRWLPGLWAILASLQLAVVLIAVDAVVVAWATFVERWYGAAAAHSDIYDTAWFAGINALLALNVLCALLIRFPWKRRQTGFVVTHLGILVLLAGCLVSRQAGVEAQLPIFEGHTAGRAYHDSSHFDLGLQLYLHKFRRKLDPGSGTASHYSSLVDFLDRSDPPQKLQENVLITLNAPVDFADPQTGRTYRIFQAGFLEPGRPGYREFERLVGKDPNRDGAFLSQLSVNYDPGRGLKYVGSLLIVAGIVMVYYLRAHFAKSSGRDAATFSGRRDAGPGGSA
jgi:hypothetical protein